MNDKLREDLEARNSQLVKAESMIFRYKKIGDVGVLLLLFLDIALLDKISK